MQVSRPNREEIFTAITNHTQFSAYFLNKLKLENSWDSTFTEGAVIDYRRFLYLVVLKKHGIIETRNATMIPSYAVDQVFHQHILYTKSYQALCNDLGYFIHHQPNEDENDLREEYAATLEAYQREFNELTLFWPNVETQFQENTNIWVNTTRHNIVSKDNGPGCVYIIFLGGLILSSVFELVHWGLAIAILVAIYISRNILLPEAVDKPDNVIKNPPVYVSSSSSCGGGGGCGGG